MSDQETRTEEATPNRLRDAREKGQVAKSADVNAAVSFFIFTLLAGALAQYVFNQALVYVQNSLGTNYQQEISRTNVGTLLINHMLELFLFLFFINSNFFL